MSGNHDVSKLDDLIVTTIDSVNGFDHSAEKADTPRFKDFFAEMAGERREVVTTLQEQSRALGGSPADYGSTAAAVHRRVEDLRLAFGGGDKAIVQEVERGEDYLKEEYERALGDDGISAATQSVIRGCYQSVLRGHDRARAFKQELEATA